jgi:hypothetical protein
LDEELALAAFKYLRTNMIITVHIPVNQVLVGGA